ncbi:MAG: hypothetical protein HY860_03295, partial [Chlamydiales bacterium]|nr:hypothetical protein [Chlamydiales bacterium]
MDKAIITNLSPASLLMENTDAIWPVSRFELKRNINRFLFPNKLNKSGKANVLQLVINTIEEHKLLKNPKRLDAEALSPMEKQILYENFLIQEDICNSKPGIGFIIDDSMNMLISINADDHLCIRKMDYSTDWHQTLEAFTRIDYQLNQHLGFAYDKTFGYLTTDTKQCGTGFTIEAFLHLPALLDDLDISQLTGTINANSVICGIDMQHHFLGNIVVIKNRFCLGVSEDQIMNSVHTSGMQLHHLEKQKRDHLIESPKIKDKVARSFGLIKHSYELSAKEALEALSY